MKQNVDLTENQIFSRSDFFQDMALGIMTNSVITGSKFPWDSKDFWHINSDDEFDLDNQKKSLIALGDKKRRAEISELRKMDSLDYCYCCGSRMNLKPWDREIVTCRKCDKYYGKQYRERFSWIRKIIGTNEMRTSVFDFS